MALDTTDIVPQAKAKKTRNNCQVFDKELLLSITAGENTEASDVPSPRMKRKPKKPPNDMLLKKMNVIRERDNRNIRDT